MTFTGLPNVPFPVVAASVGVNGVILLIVALIIVVGLIVCTKKKIDKSREDRKDDKRSKYIYFKEHFW